MLPEIFTLESPGLTRFLVWVWYFGWSNLAGARKPTGNGHWARAAGKRPKNQGQDKNWKAGRPGRCHPKKIQKQSWNVYDNKSLLFLESPQSWNVYENKDGYAKKLECL
jgi:hypothetical protein